MAEQFFLIAFASVIIERMTKGLKGILPFELGAWLIRMITIAFGIAFAFNYNLDLMEVFGYVGNCAELGTVITGVFLGGGSNLVHDLISDFNKRDVIDTEYEAEYIEPEDVEMDS